MIAAMLAPVPLHEPAVVVDVLATLRAGRSLPSTGMAVIHDLPADPTPGYVVIPDVPADPPQHLRVRALRPLLRMLAATRGATSAVLVVLRGGSADPSGDDYAWHDAFHHVIARVGLDPAGVYVLADSTVVPIGMPQPVLAET